MRRWTMMATVLAGCSQAPEASENAATAVPMPGAASVPTPVATPAAAASDLAGRWTGVEGMYLAVSPGAAAGRYRLEMQYDLDNKGVFEGEATADGIAFTRDGKREVLRPSDGDATGLKYLAGKKACLTVKPGEGYCRD